MKLLRTHIMDILGASLRNGAPPADIEALGIAVRRIDDLAPQASGILSRREARIIQELRGSGDTHRLAAEHATVTDFRRPSSVLPASARRIFHREAPPRFLGAIAVMR